MKKTVIFDLDGTIVDIVPIFYRIVNTLATAYGYRPLSPDELPGLQHLHLRQFLWQRLGWRLIFFPFMLRRGRAEYRRLVPEVALFSGMKNIIETLHTHHIRVGIVSSSEKDTIEALVTKYALPVDFTYHSSLFNKAGSLQTTLQSEQLSLAETLYVGDEVRDVEACHKIGLDIIAVTWGLNNKQALIAAGAKSVDTREALMKAIFSA